MNDTPHGEAGKLQLGILIGKFSSLERSNKSMVDKMDRFIEQTNSYIQRIEKSVITCNYNTNNKVDFKDLNERLEPTEKKLLRHGVYWGLIIGIPTTVGVIALVISIFNHYRGG